MVFRSFREIGEELLDELVTACRRLGLLRNWLNVKM